VKDSKITSIEHYRQRRAEAKAFAWRRERGLMSLRDLADEYRRSRWCRPGALAALPTDRLGREVRP
jgi:hypothetical protein